MNFDFSDDSRLLRDQARRFLAERCPPRLVRAALETLRPPAGLPSDAAAAAVLELLDAAARENVMPARSASPAPV